MILAHVCKKCLVVELSYTVVQIDGVSDRFWMPGFGGARRRSSHMGPPFGTKPPHYIPKVSRQPCTPS